MDFVGLGALNLDRLYKVPRITSGDEEIHILEMKEEPGGSAANTIYALGRLGVSCGFIGAVGDDGEGKQLVASLKKVGVDTSRVVRKSKERTGLVIGIVDKKGERSLYIMPGANNLISSKDIDLKYVKGSRFFHTSSFVQKQQLGVQKSIIKSLSGGTKLSFAPGSLYSKMGFESVSSIIKKTHVLFLNEEEVKILTSKDSYEKASRFLIKKGCRIVVVTLGESGCYITDGNKNHHVKAIRTKVVDTTGAGDSFCAGFLFGLAHDKDLYECGVMGNFLASRCISKIGARKGLLDIREFKAGLSKIL